MPGSREPVVLVHGLWMVGFELGVLRHRLQARHGFDVHVFPYSSIQGHADEIAEELVAFAGRCAGEGGRIHLVGHSLGGAFVYRALTLALRERSGNAVMLGAPLNGSRAANSAARVPLVKSLLGPHVLQELVSTGGRCWACGPDRALGAIAGSRRLGLGQFFAQFDEDNDGTIAVAETIIPGLDDHIVLPHSHMGMLYAEDVADQVAHFLRNGKFRRAANRE
jgi:pimeloyl-ACP methyl ester carboxylesterase